MLAPLLPSLPSPLLLRSAALSARITAATALQMSSSLLPRSASLGVPDRFLWPTPPLSPPPRHWARYGCCCRSWPCCSVGSSCCHGARRSAPRLGRRQDPNREWRSVCRLCRRCGAADPAAAAGCYCRCWPRRHSHHRGRHCVTAAVSLRSPPSLPLSLLPPPR